MRTGKQLILATKPYAKENRVTSWLHTLLTLFLLISCLGAAAVAPWLAVRIGASLVSGLLVVRFFVIYHDYEHHSILQKSLPARIIMTIFGIYILAPESIWKRSHDYHHNHNSKLFTADIGSYPIATKDKYLEMSSKERFGYLAIRHPFTILFGYITIFMLGMSLRSFLSCPRRHYDSLIALVVHLAANVLVFWLAGWATWLLTIFIPFFVACGLGSYLFYAQHNFPGVSFTDKDGWTYEGAALESSSYMRMSPVMAWFTGNIGYHHIHHLNSKIPFYRLPEIMREVPELQQAKVTTLYPRDVAACLRLKIWDTERKTMTGLPRR